MKRTLLLFVTMLALTLCLTACGGNGGKDTREFLSILQSGEYHITANGQFGGNYYLVDEIVCNGDYNITYRDMNDTVFRCLCHDGTVYFYLTGLQLYANGENNPPDEVLVQNMVGYDYSTAKYKGHDKQTVQGRTYPYDIYKIKRVDGTETEMNLYLTPTGTDPYAIAFPEDAIAITLSQISGEIPEDVFFEFPDTFTETDYDQIERQPEI